MPKVNETLHSASSEVHHPAMLKPLIDSTVAEFINNCPSELTSLAKCHGSPLNIIWPHAFQLNSKALKSVLQARELRHEIFYGAKANKSQSLLKAAERSGIGVDVSSIHELEAALRAGVPGGKICATGPAKTAVFHRALVSAGSLICVDSTEELDHLEKILETHPKVLKARVLLRYRPKSNAQSRFGMGPEDMIECMVRLLKQGQILAFEGFHFHLSGYAFEARVQALRELGAYVEAAREMGLNPLMIDIGGGLPIRYVDPQSYNSFLNDFNHPSHYRNQVVPNSYYPYGGDLTAAHWLECLLDAEHSPGQSVAAYLKTQNITLALEPGRSLVDQAAISVFRITRTKRLPDKKFVLFVEGSSFSACETWFSSEYLIDPILISNTVGPSDPARAYIAGHSCLDDDVITNRLIEFSTTPQSGDLLVYINTAGYQMDLLENEFHRHPMPRRLTANFDSHGQYTFSPDN